MDFYFESINENGEIPLLDLVNHAEVSGNRYFSMALNRYLREAPDRRMIVVENTTYSSFGKLLRCLDSDTIGQALIGRRTDQNSNVDFTLCCQLWLPDGIVDVRPHWTTYKKLRTYEVINTLLNPLSSHGLLERTFLTDRETADRKSWRSAPKTSASLLKAVSQLAGYPLEDDNIEPFIGSFKYPEAVEVHA